MTMLSDESEPSSTGSAPPTKGAEIGQEVRIRVDQRDEDQASAAPRLAAVTVEAGLPRGLKKDRGIPFSLKVVCRDIRAVAVRLDIVLHGSRSPSSWHDRREYDVAVLIVVPVVGRGRSAFGSSRRKNPPPRLLLFSIRHQDASSP